MSIAPAVMKEPGAQETQRPQIPQYTMQGVSRSGRLRDVATSTSQRNMAVAMHLSLLGHLVVGPLAIIVQVVLWMVSRDKGMFDDDHGRELTNVGVTALMAWALVFTGIGAIISFIWFIVIYINMIRGSMAASNGEFFRYPMTLRFIG